jgi:isopentenyl-diphosphate delta-isomerase
MRAVQENQNLLMRVDHSDRPIGLVEKKNAHLKGILHRAFSIFIFHEVESSPQVLLQQRAFHKYHSGGLWTNTCCNHAEPDVPIKITASNRLRTELEFSYPLFFSGSFYYKTDVGNEMTEHEIDHVFVAFYNPPNIHLNPEEANAFKWVNVKDLEKDLMIKRHQFTAWFPKALDTALKFLDKRKAQEH